MHTLSIYRYGYKMKTINNLKCGHTNAQAKRAFTHACMYTHNIHVQIHIIVIRHVHINIRQELFEPRTNKYLCQPMILSPYRDVMKPSKQELVLFSFSSKRYLRQSWHSNSCLHDDSYECILSLTPDDDHRC